MRMLARQSQHGRAHEIEGERGRRHEFRAFGAVAQVFMGGVHALVRIAVEQGLRRLALDDVGELPGEIVRIIDARVRSAHAEDGYQMGRITREQHGTVPVFFQRQRVGFIDSDPHGMPRRGFPHHGQQAVHAGRHIFQQHGRLRILVVAQLIVDAPDIVGLLVHQHCRAGIRRRVEIREPFRRTVALQVDIDDHIAPFIAGALQFQAQRLAHDTAPAIGRHQPVRVNLVGFVGRGNRDRGAIGAPVHAGGPRLPADIDQFRLAFGRVEQELLDMILRQVDHGRQLLVRVLRHREMQHFLVAVKTAPTGPRQAFADKTVERAQAFDDFQAAPRDADGAAARAHAIVGLDQHAAHAVAGQAQGRGQAHGAAADDQHRNMLRRCARRFAGRIHFRHMGIRVERVAHDGVLFKIVLCRHGRWAGSARWPRPPPAARWRTASPWQSCA
ncbi:hypothetical protein D3C72_1112680 [compost metagenome]